MYIYQYICLINSNYFIFYMEMENCHPLKTQSMFVQAPKQKLMKETTSLIIDCERVLRKSKEKPKEKKIHHRKLLWTNSIEMSENTLKEKQNLDIELSKLKKKIKRTTEPSCIKKTDLAENQITFTSSELKKLQLIDQFLEKGLKIPDINKMDDKSQIEEEKPLLSVPQSSYNEQLKNINKWAEQGNQQSSLEQINSKNKLQILKNQLMNEEKYKKEIRENAKPGKGIRFQKHRSRVMSKSHFMKRSSESKLSNNYRSSNISVFNKLIPSVLSNFSTKKYIERIQKSHFPVLSKPQKMLNTNQLKSLKTKYKLQNLTNYFSTKYQSFPKNTYMTEERTQGLYECQMLRRAKAILSHEEYMNMKVNYVDKLDDSLSSQNQECVPKEQKVGERLNRMNSHREIDGILSLNKRRLKAERQKVIMTLKC